MLLLHFAALGRHVALSVKLRPDGKLMARALLTEGGHGLYACMESCPWCGTLTPHWACHDHASTVEGGAGMAGTGTSVRFGIDKPVQACLTGRCPQWRPGEQERMIRGLRAGVTGRMDER